MRFVHTLWQTAVLSWARGNARWRRLRTEMKAMEISQRYYEDYCRPALDSRFPELSGRLAAGLVGEGSECFGFDDEISQDHDWGAAVCLWLTEEDFTIWGKELRTTLDESAREAGRTLPMRKETPMAAGRSGVMDIHGFYYRHTGFPTGPITLFDWMRVPDDRLATVTNGAVFSDPLGDFSAVRNTLLAYYPEDVRRKKLASRLAMMAQTGQYNLGRCFRRGEKIAAHLSESQFVSTAMSAVFLLNRRYMPFYKWSHRAVCRLPLLGAEVGRLLESLVMSEPGEKEDLVEEICTLVASELRRQVLSHSDSDFMLEQAFSVQSSIENETLRGLSVFG